MASSEQKARSKWWRNSGRYKVEKIKMSNSLEERLRANSSAFDGLLALIPAKYYYDETSQDQWKAKKKTKVQSKNDKVKNWIPNNVMMRHPVRWKSEKEEKRCQCRWYCLAKAQAYANAEAEAEAEGSSSRRRRAGLPSQRWNRMVL